MRSECAHGHPQRGPRDYFPDRRCRHCDKVHATRYRERAKLAMALLRKLEKSGVSVAELTDTDGAAIALKWLNESDPRVLAQMEKRHPAMIQKIRRQLDRIDEGRDPFVASR